MALKPNPAQFNSHGTPVSRKPGHQRIKQALTMTLCTVVLAGVITVAGVETHSGGNEPQDAAGVSVHGGPIPSFGQITITPSIIAVNRSVNINISANISQPTL